MTDYIDSLGSAAPHGVVVTLAKGKTAHPDGSITDYDVICCECGPHALSFQSANDLSKDAKTVADWWDQTARHPLIIPTS